MRFTLALAVLLCGLGAAPLQAQMAIDAWIESQNEAPLKKARQEEVAKAVAAWKANRDALIKALLKRGAKPEEAAEAVDDMIAGGDRQVAEGAEALDANSPKMVALDRKLTIMTGVSNLSYDRFAAFAASHGLTIGPDFYQCLCSTYSIMGAGISFHPGETGDCKNAMPCKGGNWGCVSYDLPHDPIAWGFCSAVGQAEGSKGLTDQIADKVKAAQDKYDRDVCDRLRTVLDATKGLLAEGKLKPNDQSFMATHDLEKTFGDFITGLEIKGITEAAAGALADKIPTAIEGWTGWNPVGQDAPTGLGYHLTVGEPPSETGLKNPYVRITKVLSGKEVIGDKGANVPMSYEMQLARRIQKSGGNLSPGDVFRMAAEITGGDVPLAGLVAHNLLKEAAYAKREGKPMVLAFIPYDLNSSDPATAAQFQQIKATYSGAFDKQGTFSGKTFILSPDIINAQLQDIRPVYDPHVSDRLGPWYHSFGLIFVGTDPSFGELAAYGGASIENITRWFGAGSTRSLGKEAANRCAAVLTSLMNRNIEAKAGK